MKIGEYNELTILRFTSVGAYLTDEEDNDVLLPNKYLTDEMLLDDIVNVFVYRDSEDRAVATTEKPLIEMGGFAYLKATAVSHFGAFVDWGLEKELMVPFKEQNLKLEEGRYYLTHLFLDDQTDRVVGSTRVNRYLKDCEEELLPEMEVDLLICETTDLGVKVVVNNKYSGLIFRSDISKPIKRGDSIKGYVAKVREDGKIDVRLNIAGYDKISGSAKDLLELLQRKKSLNLTDKSDPDDIREVIGMSKKTFKQAVGNLYRKRLIVIGDGKITLIE